MERKTFPGTFDSLEGIRLLVKEEAQRAGLSKKRTYKLMLAIDEIATNIIMHGYEENHLQGSIDVICEADAEQLTTILEDDAPAFNPLEHNRPTNEQLNLPLELRPIGGMGIHLTFDAVDTFTYEYLNNRNRNIFIMKAGESESSE